MIARRVYLIALGLISMALDASASPPPPPFPPVTWVERASADYGAPISPLEAKRKAEEFFSRNLYDPHSAKYAWGNIERGWLRDIRSPNHVGDVVFGYALDAFVNEKNRRGDYIGYLRYQFIFYEGSIKIVYAERLEDSLVLRLWNIRWTQIYPEETTSNINTGAPPAALPRPP
jgi:hypothetical protein